MKLLYDSKLGRGAFADVWRAEDALGRSVAVKFFNDTDLTHAERNALDHAKALARVRHPAVVQVLSLEEQPHPETGAAHLAIVMEFADGPSLSMHNGALSPERARVALHDLSEAIQAIHDAGLVHGDLHEANVLITRDGAKVIDILYTHSLAEVGTRTAHRTRADDIRALAAVARIIVSKATSASRAIEEAYFQASCCRSSRLMAFPSHPLMPITPARGLVHHPRWRSRACPAFAAA